MHIVIMAGGSGTRFWPLSRAFRPKQFLAIVGDRPMVLATYDRVKTLVPQDRVLLVVGKDHLTETKRLFEPYDVTILAEPRGRNTAPCIGLAAKYVQHLGSDEPLVILPADHYIADPQAFRKALVQAVEIASQGGIVTLGIVPTRPESGYGYIERDIQPPAVGEAYAVRRFVEKPNFETAMGYLRQGNFYWNAGIFVATPGTLLEEFAVHMPSFYRGLAQLEPAFNTVQFPAALKVLYNDIEGISFDYAIMEKTSRPVYVIPCDCGWSDVGSWQSLYEVRKAHEQDGQGNVKEGEALLLDCRDSLVVSQGRRWVAALGLESVLVVDTEDALLVADLRKSQEVREIIAHLQDAELKQLL